MSVSFASRNNDVFVLNDHEVGLAIAAEAGADYFPATSGCVARIHKGHLMGGAVYTGFTQESVQMHCAGLQPRWLCHDLLWLGFDYPFNQLQVKRIFGQVPALNWRARRFNVSLGFRPVVTIEGVYKGGDACVLMKMERDECRFLAWQPKGIQSMVVDEEDTDGR